MSKNNVFKFLSRAAEDETIKQKLESTTSTKELASIGQEAGYEFSPQNVDEAVNELKKQPGFFGALAEAVLQIFSPHRDNYPATGVQSYSGDPNPNP
ncbi:MAG: Nif11-like leader peptide family natural product precursor [Phormidesmis sp.]